jgi:hypothetical protein
MIKFFEENEIIFINFSSTSIDRANNIFLTILTSLLPKFKHFGNKECVPIYVIERPATK